MKTSFMKQTSKQCMKLFHAWEIVKIIKMCWGLKIKKMIFGMQGKYVNGKYLCSFNLLLKN